METLISRNKKEKEKNLYNAAYELFLDKGVESTTVDQIVKKAGVAKGTFYLYFKDKYDLINKLIYIKSYSLAKEALERTRDQNIEEFEGTLLYFTDYVIEYFKRNKIMLRIIKKNFSSGLYRNDMFIEGTNEVLEILNIFVKNLSENGYTEEESKLTLYMIIELVGGVCYNSIILKKPCDIDKIKPILFKQIKKMIL